MDAGMQRDINNILRKLDGLEQEVKRGAKSDLAKAAKIVASAIALRAPIGTKPHSRYSKGSVRRRSGNGRKVETYQPGNLKKSIKVLRFRRARLSVFAGAKSKGGVPDGYYAPFLEFGTKHMRARPFILPAVEASKTDALRKALALISARLETYKRQNTV